MLNSQWYINGLPILMAATFVNYCQRLSSQCSCVKFRKILPLKSLILRHTFIQCNNKKKEIFRKLLVFKAGLLQKWSMIREPHDVLHISG